MKDGCTWAWDQLLDGWSMNSLHLSMRAGWTPAQKFISLAISLHWRGKFMQVRDFTTLTRARVVAIALAASTACWTMTAHAQPAAPAMAVPGHAKLGAW